MEFQFNAGRYFNRIDNISFISQGERNTHTDSLCCFFDSECSEKHPIDKSGKMILIACIIDAKKVNKPLQKIVHEMYSFSHKHFYYPCPNLKYTLAMEEKGLVMGASCNIYNENPDSLSRDWKQRMKKCKKYPHEKDPPEEFCFYDKFSCSPADQKLRAHAVHLLLLAMRKAIDNDFLKDFSAGEMRRYLARWYLIPVPMKKACEGAECQSK